MDEDAEMLASKIEKRRAVVTAVLWAATHPKEMAEIASTSATRDDAVRTLSSAPYAWSEFEADHMLNLPFARVTHEAVERITNELDRLNRGEFTGGTY